MNRSRKGSISIFLVFILAAMFCVVMIYINVSAGSAAESCSDAVLNMSARAVLSEFDLDLKKDYGIFAYYEPYAEGKIRHYFNGSVGEKNGYTELDSLVVLKNGYSMADIGNFRDAILEHVRYLKAGKLLKEEKENGKSVSQGNAVLRNSSVLNALPSHECGKTGDALGKIKSVLKDGIPPVSEFVGSGTENVLENEYIMECFRNVQNDDVGGHETFFSNEVEYILSGTCDDEKNRKKVRRKIIAAREISNFRFIYTNPVMRAEVIALAESMSPGPGAVLMQLVIASAWALAESENDMRILEHGKKVAYKKTLKTWATDIESAVKGTDKGYIDTASKKGFSYDTYLRLLLFLEDESVKLLRTMDLIQINMKGNYNGSFLLKEYSCGLRLDAVVNNRKFRYEHRY